MELPSKGKPVREFFEIEANALYNRFKSVEAILPSAKGKGSSHSAEEGRFVESLIRQFLNKHLPNDLIAISGFILRPSTKTGESNYERVDNDFDKYSSQIDIIVYDQSRFPIYERFEEFGIVPAEGVIAIISIKKNLRISDIKHELESLKRTAELCYDKNISLPYTGLFCFTSNFKETEKNLATIKSIYEKTFLDERADFMINELTIMDKFMIFKFREDPNDQEITFVNINCKGKMHIPLQRLIQSVLGVYYRKSLNRQIERPGYISLEEGTHNKAQRFVHIRKRIVENIK